MLLKVSRPRQAVRITAYIKMFPVAVKLVLFPEAVPGKTDIGAVEKSC